MLSVVWQDIGNSGWDFNHRTQGLNFAFSHTSVNLVWLAVEFGTGGGCL